MGCDALPQLLSSDILASLFDKEREYAMPSEGSSGVVLRMHVRPPNQTKQCHGTCGLSKPQSKYVARQWVKPGKHICLDCTRSAHPPPTERAHPPPTKQCNGPCRLSKPAAEYTMGQWRITNVCATIGCAFKAAQRLLKSDP